MRWLLILWIASLAYITTTLQLLDVAHRAMETGEPVQAQVIVLEKPVPIQTPVVPTETFVTTAYSAGFESTGKRPGDPAYGITYSGLPVKPGIVAVDPDVIPLGSIVWVEGYGLAVAADTGSAIKGKRIDVYFHDPDNALQWGVREVQVAVLR